MAVKLDLQIATQITTLPKESDFLKWCEVALCQRMENVELTIRLVDEDESRHLNKTYRDKDYSTNVLSFSSDAPVEFLDLPLLGDLVICVPIVIREALEQHKDERSHWAHMVIHGCLHLLGFDHVEDAEAQVMEDLERKYMAELGFEDPYLVHT